MTSDEESQIVANDREESRDAQRDYRGGYRRISGVWVEESRIPDREDID